MPRPQFTLRALLILMLAVACFFGGIRFERERQRRADEAALLAAQREDAVRIYPLVGPGRLITLPDGTKHFQHVPNR
jgi:hypothetical protein